MRVILTGSAGFIGHFTALKLLREGHEVLGLDCLSDYYDVRLKQYRLNAIPESETFTQLILDLADKKKTLEAFESFRPDMVIHLAAQAGVRYSIDHPNEYTHSNVEAFLNILEGCRHHNVPRLIYASSSSVYGGITEIPFHESMSADQPISLYAATKKANELMAHCYSHLYGFETVGLRFFTVYGPKGRPDMALWLFTEAILAGKPIKVFNHGDMRRDFTYVDDIVQGIMGTVRFQPPERSTIYNLGNHKSEKLMYMIGCLEESLGCEAKKTLLPMQPGDVPETYANIDKAMADLDFEPQTDLASGIDRFVEWYKNDWLVHLEKEGEK